MPHVRRVDTHVSWLGPGVSMSDDRHDACCSHCGGRDLASGIRVSLTAEVGNVGLSYKDGLLMIGTEPMRAEVCTACGTIRRLYVENVNHRWVAR